MKDQLTQLQKEALAALASVDTLDGLVELRNSFLGKKGQLTTILKGVKDLSPEDKATIGKESNDLRKELLAAFEARERDIKKLQIEKQLKEEFEDMTIPIARPSTQLILPIK